MSESFRSEKDTMGVVRVPAGALYGAQTTRAIENFPLSGRGLPVAVIRSLGRIKAAAAIVNARAGLLDLGLARVIEQAAIEVAEGRHDDQFPVDVFQTGSGTSSNMNANEVIANRAAILLGKPPGTNALHANDHVNLGQSSNDVFPAAVHLALLACAGGQLLPAMTSLAATLHDFADRTFDVIKTGRTHLMDAMPIRMGQEFRGHACQVDNAVQRLGQAMAGLRDLPLGGTAVGTGANSWPGFGAAVCAILGERWGEVVRETPAHFQAQSSLDAISHASGVMHTFATALYKITNDVRWMASSAIQELRLPAVQPGSSIMPAKQNPVVCEAVLMVCAQVFGNDTVVAFGNSQGQFELNTMMPVMARNALESAHLLTGACEVLGRCMQGAEVGEAVGAAARSNPVLATALNPHIGYEAAAAIARLAASSGRSVLDIARERTKLDPALLEDLLDPAKLCGEWGRQR